MKALIFSVIFVIMFIAANVFAEDVKISKEERMKMADVHTKMAECLKSDKSMSECRDEVRKSCQESLGKESCPMMSKGKMGGMMKGRGMMMYFEEDDKKGK